MSKMDMYWADNKFVVEPPQEVLGTIWTGLPAWRSMHDAPKDGTKIFVLAKFKDEDGHIPYVVSWQMLVERGSGKRFPWVFSEGDGGALAEHIPVAWMQIPQVSGL